MGNKYKKKVKFFLDHLRMLKEFYLDYRDYRRWNYNNPKVKSLCAHEFKILRQTHIIEKGLSLSIPRKGFGQTNINVLFKMLDEYLSMRFPVDNLPFQNAICVLNQYVIFQRGIGYENTEINNKLAGFQQYIVNCFKTGIGHTTLDELRRQINGNYPEFFHCRHSMRQFSSRKINLDDIKKAVKLAIKAPTACNRQACRVYFYENNETNIELGKIIDGNTGFDNEIKNYLVITADISAFYDTFERNQIYIEAGIFAMSLIQALHYYSIGSCVLQNGEYYKKNLKIKHICGNIPKNEKIALFIAIGYYKDEFSYAVSKRKNVEDVLIKA